MNDNSYIPHIHCAICEQLTSTDNSFAGVCFDCIEDEDEDNDLIDEEQNRYEQSFTFADGK